MSFLSFICPMLCLFILNTAIVKLTNKKFGSAFPITILILPIILLFSHYIFKNLLFGIYFIYALIAVSFALFIINVRDKDYRKNVFSTGFVVYLFIYVFIYILSRGLYFYTWDELSHWGPTINQIVATNKMYKGLDHSSYPPLIQLFEYSLVKYGLLFEEYNLKFAVHLFNFTIFCLPVSERLDGENKSIIKITKGIIVFLMAFFLAIGIDSYNSFRTIYIDVTVSMYFAYMLSILIYEEDKYVLAIASFGFIMLKDVAILFVAFAMLYVFISFVNDIIVKKEKKDAIFKHLKIFLCIMIPALVSYLLWHIYKVNANLLNEQFSMNRFSVVSFFEIFLGKLSGERLEGFKAFYNSVLNTNLSRSPIPFTYIVSYVVIVVLLIIFTVVSKSEDKKSLFIKHLMFVTITYIIYMLFMMNIYVNVFNGSERTEVASYSRYMNSYVLGIYLITFIYIYKYFDFKNILIAVYMSMAIILGISFIEQRFDSRINQQMLMDPLMIERTAYKKLSDKVNENEKVIVVINQTFYSNLVKGYYTNTKGSVELYDLNNLRDDNNIKSFIDDLKNYNYLYVIDKDGSVIDIFVGVLSQYIEENKINTYNFWNLPANEIINIG